MLSKSRAGKAGRIGKSNGRRHLQIETLEPRNLLAAIAMSSEEQLVIELINRARQAPAVEAARLGVGLNDGLPAGTITSTPKQPLAPNQLLIGTAVAHSQDMLNRDFFDHTNPSGQSAGDRITAAGYSWIAYAENIAWATSIDAKGFHEMLFRSAGHRKNILKENFREIGVGIRRGDVVKGTEDFGNRWDDAFITGVAFSDDVVKDDFYTIGEGSAGLIITATADGGQTVYTTTTGNSGGYTLQVPPGTYTVTATRSDLGASMIVDGVVIGSTNSKVDFIVWEYVPVAPVAHGDRAMTEAGQSTVIDVLANDTGDKHQVIVTGNPAHGQTSVNATTGAITYTPQASFVGFDQLKYQVRGSTGLPSNTVVVQITVIDLQDSPWTNPDVRYDVNASGSTTPEDVLILVNDLNTSGARFLPAPSPQGSYPLPYCDVSGDGKTSPMDILYILNYLNAQMRGEAEGEGPSARETVWAKQENALLSDRQRHTEVAWTEAGAIQSPFESSTSLRTRPGFEDSGGDGSTATRYQGQPQPSEPRERSLRIRKRLDATDRHFSEIGRNVSDDIDADALDPLWSVC